MAAMSIRGARVAKRKVDIAVPAAEKPAETRAVVPDPFAELLKRREIKKVYYFHADHYEPWGSGLNDKALKGVENFARQTLNSPYGAKLSLFYSTYTPHRLEPGTKNDEEARRAEGDSIVFHRRTEPQDRMITNVIRPLVTQGSHEMHLHVHHEWWTRNDSHFNSPVSHWVNEHSCADLDQRRLDLFFSLATAVIAEETGAPFDRWGFVHGNWALAGSDPRICKIENELSMIMKYGGFGDFTFPAGRAICDPRLETPFTCLPLDVIRAYDLPESEASQVARDTKVMKPDRFFIWNSKIKADYSSLDYYYAPNRDRFQKTDLMVEKWLTNSVVIENCLFVKTHAHSMYGYYNMAEPDSLIPHCYPDTVAIFDRLARACDRADIELQFVTVNDVMDLLHAIDGTSVPPPKKVEREAAPSLHPARPAAPAIIPLALASPSSPDFEDSLVKALEASGNGNLLHNADRLPQIRSVYRYIRQAFSPAETGIVLSSTTDSGLALAFAAAGFETLVFEPDEHRLGALHAVAAALDASQPGLKDRLRTQQGTFPEAFTVGSTPSGKARLLVALQAEAAAERQTLMECLPIFDDAVFEFATSEIERPSVGESKLPSRWRRMHDLVDQVCAGQAREIWHLHPPQVMTPAALALPAAEPRTAAPPPRSGAHLQIDLAAFDLELVQMQRDWVAGDGKAYPPDDSYALKIERNAILQAHERTIAETIAQAYDTASTELSEVGSGCGALALLLARHGFSIHGYECDRRRYPVCQSNLSLQAATHAGLADRLTYTAGFFPDVFRVDARHAGRRSVCIITNVTHSYTAAHQDLILRTAALFDEIILDLGRFGVNRDTQEERDRLLAKMVEAYFDPLELIYKQGPYEYWRLRARKPEQKPAAAAAPAPLRASADVSASTAIFPLRNDDGVLFSIYGERAVPNCPVCGSADTTLLWRIPLNHLPDPISVFGGSVSHLPTRETPAPIFCYDFCQSCQSIFMNPTPSFAKERYRRDDYAIGKMAKPEEWRGYEEMYDQFSAAIPADARIMLDAAAGVGQYLRIAQKRSSTTWERLIGLDLSQAYVDDMVKHGIQAHVFDLDNDDLAEVIGEDKVDFITFCEAFEQMEHPLRVLKKLLDVLRPGGRLFFTAQRYGSDARGPIRPAEQVYLGAKLVGQLPERLECQVIHVGSSNMRYYVTLEK